MKTLLILLLSAAPAAAQAGRISDAVVLASIVTRTADSWQQDHRGRAFAEQGCALGVTLATVEVIKLGVHRERPDHSDRKSFPSGHTGTAMAMGWTLKFGMAFPLGVAPLRVLANKHYWTDTLGGALTGAAASYLCQEWIR